MPDHGEETYVGHGKLEGRKALITGGDSGIGRAVAIAFAREGADVAISYLAEEQSDAEDTLGWVRRAGRTGVLVPGDLVERETCQQVVADAVEGLGGLDILVNNAGYHWDRGAVRSRKGWSPSTSSACCAPTCTPSSGSPRPPSRTWARGSSIIMTTSIQAYDPSPRCSTTPRPRRRINNLTVNLAASLGPKGIRVNAVAPGPIWTPLQPATRDKDKIETFGADTPLGPSRAARRGGPGLRLPRVAVRRELRLGHRHRGHRRWRGLLTGPPPSGPRDGGGPRPQQPTWRTHAHRQPHLPRRAGARERHRLPQGLLPRARSGTPAPSSARRPQRGPSASAPGGTTSRRSWASPPSSTTS